MPKDHLQRWKVIRGHFLTFHLPHYPNVSSQKDFQKGIKKLSDGMKNWQKKIAVYDAKREIQKEKKDCVCVLYIYIYIYIYIYKRRS